jgi:methionine aminopeptidase
MEKSKKKEEHEEDEGSEEEEQEENETFEKNKTMLDKYTTAARITNDVMKYVMGLCVPDADIAEICIKGDKKIEEEIAKVYCNKKTKVLEKGIAFPTCISINEFCGHFSPLKDESLKLKAGDVAKM